MLEESKKEDAVLIGVKPSGDSGTLQEGQLQE